MPLGQIALTNPFLQQSVNQLHQVLLGNAIVAQPATPLGWKDRFGIAERRALKLFKDMYGRKALWLYLRKGYVEYHAKDGRTYRIFRAVHDSIEVFQRTKLGKKKLYKLCLTDTESIPLTDRVLKCLWLLRCDANSLHEQANIQSA